MVIAAFIPGASEYVLTIQFGEIGIRDVELLHVNTAARSHGGYISVSRTIEPVAFFPAHLHHFLDTISLLDLVSGPHHLRQVLVAAREFAFRETIRGQLEQNQLEYRTLGHYGFHLLSFDKLKHPVFTGVLLELLLGEALPVKITLQISDTVDDWDCNPGTEGLPSYEASTRKLVFGYGSADTALSHFVTVFRGLAAMSKLRMQLQQGASELSQLPFTVLPCDLYNCRITLSGVELHVWWENGYRLETADDSDRLLPFFDKDHLLEELLNAQKSIVLLLTV